MISTQYASLLIVPAGLYLRAFGSDVIHVSRTLIGANVYSRENVERFLGQDQPGWMNGIDASVCEAVPAAACGCCGRTLRDLRHGRNGDGALWHVVGSYRCERHRGRVPCCIEGCGKTFAMKGDDHYGMTVICGKHWRQAPRHLRTRDTKFRRLLKARRMAGKQEKIGELLSRNFNRAVESVRRGHVIDETEISKLFGWGDVA